MSSPAVAALFAFLGLAAAAIPLRAHETNGTTAWTGVVGGNTGTVVEPSGLTVQVSTASVATRGLVTVGDAATPLAVSVPLNSRFAATSMFSPTVNVGTTQSVNILNTVLANCPIASPSSTTTCTNMGTLTLTFSEPVRNPVIHITGIGGNRILGSNIARLNARLVLASSSPAGASLGARSTGAVNLAPSGDTIETANVNASVRCDSPTDTAGTAAAPAACGSVQVNGTVTQLTFNVEMKYRVVSCCSMSVDGSQDAFNLTVSLPQDFGDAPTGYGVPRHVIGDLRIDGSVDADHTNTENPATSPFASATATGDDTETATANDNEPGDDETFAWPALLRGVTSAVTVPLSGVSEAGSLCGYVDFDNNGAFAASEGFCTSIAAGSTSATLNVATPSTAVNGQRMARLRAAYGTLLTASTPATNLSSGEVEDMLVQVDNPPTINLRKTTLGATGGAFGFTLTNTVQTTGTVTTSAINTPAQVDGDAGTAGTQVFTVPAANQIVTIDESTIPPGWSLGSATCTDAGNATVGSLSGTVYTLPASATVPNAVLTCTFTNRLITASLSIAKSNSASTLVAGSSTTYTITVTNNGPDAATGAVVTDPASGRAGLTCPTTGTVTCSSGTAGACSTPTTTVGALTSPGYTLGTLPANTTATLSFVCTVN